MIGLNFVILTLGYLMFPFQGRRPNRGRGRGNQMNVPNLSNQTLREEFSERRIMNMVNQRVRIATSGNIFTPSITPTIITVQPWNHVNLRIYVKLAATSLSYTVEKVWQALATQVGMYKDAAALQTKTFMPMDLRFQAIQAWDIAGSNIPGIVRLFPINFETQQEMLIAESIGQKNMWARIGYRWPNNLANFTHSSTVHKDNIVFQIDGTDSTFLEIHLTVLWKGANSVELKTVPVYVDSKDEDAVMRVSGQICAIDNDDNQASKIKADRNEIEIKDLHATITAQQRTIEKMMKEFNEDIISIESDEATAVT